MRPLASLLILFLTACATAPQPVVTQTVAPAAPRPASHRFKILQVNDVYKIEGLARGTAGGLARLRTLRTHLESDGTPLLVLHAGDALYPSVASKFLGAEQMVAVMNLLDGDAAARDEKLIVTFGNHELDNKDDRILMQRIAQSQFRWLATNTLRCDTNQNCAPFPSVERTAIVDLQGLRVGIMGLLYPLDRGYAKSTDVLGAAREAAGALRAAGARVVVAITHQDMPDDVKLVESVPGIDVVIGGHDHMFMQQRVGNIWITKADADVKSAMVYDVTVPAEGAVRTTPIRVVVDTTIEKDTQVQAAVDYWMGQLAGKLRDEKIGETLNLLEGVEPAVRGRETALGNLLADVARRRMKTEIGVVHGGGIRINDDIPPGDIRRYDMEGVFYYDNKLVAFEATGQQLLEMLRNSVSRVDAGDGRFLQVSGLRFRYGKSGNGYTVEASDVQVGGKPLELDRKYSIATVDYLYNNGTEDGYVLFAPENRPPKINVGLETSFRDETEAYIRSASPINVTIERRIERK